MNHDEKLVLKTDLQSLEYFYFAEFKLLQLLGTIGRKNIKQIIWTPSIINVIIILKSCNIKGTLQKITTSFFHICCEKQCCPEVYVVSHNWNPNFHTTIYFAFFPLPDSKEFLLYLVVIIIFKWCIFPLGSQHMGSTSVPQNWRLLPLIKKYRTI